MPMDFLQQLAQDYPFVLDFWDQLVDALYICNADGELIYINKSAELLDGYSSTDIYGQSVYTAYGLDNTNSPLLRALYTHKPVRNFAFRYYINGREVHQICNAHPIYRQQECIGAYTIQHDVTNVKEIIEKNIALQQQLFGNYSEQYKQEDKSFDQLKGEHPLFVACKHLAQQAARGESSVFITGNTGSGKEIFSRCIHNASSRCKGPFLAVNCAAIPETLIESLLFGTSKGIYTGAVEREGLFEQAAGGTLFLDEINSMPLESQAKLLRVLEDHTIQHLGSKKKIRTDVRIISSSNTPPQEAIQKRQIREDLFYRLNVINIMIPDLSARRSDVFLLTNHFIAHYNTLFGKHVMDLDDDVLAFFLAFDWPGNVRQLKHCIESAMNFVGKNELTIQWHHLPQYITQNDPVMAGGYRRKAQTPAMNSVEQVRSTLEMNSNVFETIRQQEKEEIIQALMVHQGNVTRTAKVLGITRQALIYRIKKYKIQ